MQILKIPKVSRVSLGSRTLGLALAQRGVAGPYVTVTVLGATNAEGKRHRAFNPNSYFAVIYIFTKIIILVNYAF